MVFTEYLGSTNSELIATFQKTFLTTDFKVLHADTENM